jgi:hypothetical protein
MGKLEEMNTLNGNSPPLKIDGSLVDNFLPLNYQWATPALPPRDPLGI